MTKYIKHILSETIFLLPYFLMSVSFLSVIVPWLGWNFDKNFWCNSGGYSLATDILFLYVFTLNKNYCLPTRALPVSLTIVSLFNITASFFSEYFAEYKTMFEIFVLSVTLAVLFILWLMKLTKDVYGNYITRHTK